MQTVNSTKRLGRYTVQASTCAASISVAAVSMENGLGHGRLVNCETKVRARGKESVSRQPRGAKLPRDEAAIATGSGRRQATMRMTTTPFWDCERPTDRVRMVE